MHFQFKPMQYQTHQVPVPNGLSSNTKKFCSNTTTPFPIPKNSVPVPILHESGSKPKQIQLSQNAQFQYQTVPVPTRNRFPFTLGSTLVLLVSVEKKHSPRFWSCFSRFWFLNGQAARVPPMNSAALFSTVGRDLGPDPWTEWTGWNSDLQMILSVRTIRLAIPLLNFLFIWSATHTGESGRAKERGVSPSLFTTSISAPRDRNSLEERETVLIHMQLYNVNRKQKHSKGETDGKKKGRNTKMRKG